MIDQADFLYFDSGTIRIGINQSDLESIPATAMGPGIKRDYLIASTPAKTINYNSFYIHKRLVTLSEFMEFILETGYVTESEKEGWGWVWNNRWIKKEGVSWKCPFMNETDEKYNSSGDLFPVMQVSWNDAVEFTKWFSVHSGKRFRLPYEFEWEILANFTGISSLKETSIETYAEKEEFIADDDFINRLEKSLGMSQYQLGLVWEWTTDWYKGYDDSIKNKDFGDIYKTLRGGSILSENIQRTREFRFRRCPTARSPYYGFRLVTDRF